MFLLKFIKNIAKNWRDEYEELRCPQRLPKCYEMTEEERLQAALYLMSKNNEENSSDSLKENNK
jgi:hypothetical protein